MRKIEYISPSALSLWRQDPEAYYVRYLCDNPLPREPQTQPMSIGSAFDAYIKNYLHEMLFGKGYDPRFDLDALIEAQVQKQWLDWATLHGKYAFEQYLESGAATDLALELQQATNKPRFEIEVKGVVSGYREGVNATLGGVTLLGKMDVFYINQFGQSVILDFKVSGYCSKYNVSPMPGYIRIRKDPKNNGHHKDCVLHTHNGTLINCATYLENLNLDWASQLTIYAWLSSDNVGDDFIAGIDQLCCSSNGSEYPSIRIAEHRLRVSKEFQYKLFSEAQELWNIVHSDHVFRSMSKEESQQRCTMLDQQSSTFDPNDPMDQAFLNITQSQSRYIPNKPKS